MALDPFETDDDAYTTSITMDASTVRDTTVTAAAHAPRERESDILTTIYEPVFADAHGLVFVSQ